MEHRHDGQHAIVAGQPEDIRHAARVGVQYGRAMAVEHALWVARRAGRVTESARRTLVELWPVERRWVWADEGLVARDAAAGGRRQRRLGRQCDRAFDTRQLALERTDQRQQRRVDEQQSIRGVIDDELYLLREQSRIDRVQHGTHARHREIELEMPVIVPGERANPVARANASALQRIGELGGASEDLAIGAAMPGVVAPSPKSPRRPRGSAVRTA